jgi:hypothetical protein
MALLSRIYFNAVFGALGGLLGWMLFGVFGDRATGSDLAGILQNLLGGALIGGAIGYFVVSVEAIRDRALAKFARLATYGLLIGAVGGAIGMLLGDLVNTWIVGLGGGLFVDMLARGIGWTFLGVAIGMSEGFAARSMGKFSYGTIGGALGGFIGGCLFMLFLSMTREATPAGALAEVLPPQAAGQAGGATTTYLWGAVGLVILGACIGSLSALVQSVFQPASVKVMRGWQEGREYPLEKPATLLGRHEHADIALFRDMKVEKQHCFIKRVGERFILVNNNAPPEHTRVNDAPVHQSRELRDGDRIQLGNVLLRFQARAAVNRARPRRPLPTPVVAGGGSSQQIRK